MTREGFIEKWFTKIKKANWKINVKGITLMYHGYTIDSLNVIDVDMIEMANALLKCGYEYRKKDVLISDKRKIPYNFNISLKEINETIGYIIHVPSCNEGMYLAGYLLHLYEDNYLKERGD